MAKKEEKPAAEDVKPASTGAFSNVSGEIEQKYAQIPKEILDNLKKDMRAEILADLVSAMKQSDDKK